MISINNVRKAYYRGPEVLNGLDFKCEKGNIYTLVGKNGTGKSTLINAIAGLLSVDNGNIEIMGEGVGPRKRSALSRVGFVFEEHSLVQKFTAREQLQFTAGLYGMKNYKDRVHELMELLELPSDNSKYIEAYSTGMKSKVAIGCALIHFPDILILDEPFRGLDIPISNKLFGYIKDYVGNDRCAFITTHQINIISEISDFILILKEGRIDASFSFEALLKESAIYADTRNALGMYLEKCIM